MLPPEILGKIFVECLPSDPCARLDPTQAPISLSQVCTSWRTIAFSQHALWDTVIFTSNSDSTSAARRFIHEGGVETWFERTRSDSLLSLGEVGSGDSPLSRGSSVIFYEDFADLIVKYAPRLRFISIGPSRRAPDSTGHSVDKLPHDADYPELQSLSVYLGNPLICSTMATTFKTAPKLHEVVLTLPLFGSPMALQLPWLQLTKVILLATQGMDVNTWLAVFDACPHMRECVIPRSWKSRNLPPPPPPPRTNIYRLGSYDPLRRSHTALKSLTLIAEGSAEDWFVFKQFIDFPFLEHLEILSKEGKFFATELVLKCSRLKTFRKLKSIVFGSSKSPLFLAEIRRFMRLLAVKPDAFKSLVHLTIPREACEFDMGVEGISALLESRSPTETYLGLRVDVTGVDDGERRMYWEPSVAKRLPEAVANRLRIVGGGLESSR